MTITLGDLNYIAIAVSAVAAQAIGAAWYSPLLFGKAWMTEVGLSAEQLSGRGRQARIGYLVAVLGSLIAAWVLAMLVQASGATNIVDGIVLALMVGVGFVASAMAVNYVFESKSLRIFLINAGYPVLSVLIMGVILTLWD